MLISLTRIPPDFSGLEIFQLRRYQPMNTKNRALAQALHDLADSLVAENVACIVREYYPGESSSAVVERLTDDIRAAHQLLRNHSFNCDLILSAWQERMAPLVARATRRTLDLVTEIRAVEFQLAQVACDLQERRKKMVEAGVPEVDIERLIVAGQIEHAENLAKSRREKLVGAGVPASEIERLLEDESRTESGLKKRRLKLIDEQRALESYLSTRDESHLPQGFADPDKASAAPETLAD